MIFPGRRYTQIFYQRNHRQWLLNVFHLMFSPLKIRCPQSPKGVFESLTSFVYLYNGIKLSLGERALVSFTLDVKICSKTFIWNTCSYTMRSYLMIPIWLCIIKDWSKNVIRHYWRWETRRIEKADSTGCWTRPKQNGFSLDLEDVKTSTVFPIWY